MIKKIYIFLFLMLANISIIFAGDIRDNIKPVEDSEVVVGLNIEGGEGINSVLIYIKETIFYLLMIISVGVFLYVGFKLVMTRGNAEEFKKAMLSFVYAIIGLAIVSLSYVMVKFVAGIQF